MDELRYSSAALIPRIAEALFMETTDSTTCDNLSGPLEFSNTKTPLTMVVARGKPR